ncbi:hypothetical protein RND81_11G081400 [Saponaria officinalis]|uniref:Uncharacterized protein n=1 Tax=Saponaria officinalis TaxID=3572 RepID=A0AAW1HJM6_SAPOF
MKPEKKLVKDLNDKTGPHSIRVKVINKTNTQNSPTNKSLNYQRITFQDEEIRPMPEKYRINPDDHPYQLSFGGNTIIKPVEGSKPPLGPEYIPIASIPRTITADDRYDNLLKYGCIVMLLEFLSMLNRLRQIPRPTGEAVDVHEMVVVDPSTEQPLIITAWTELATKEGDQLKEVFESFSVTGFTCLKPFYHKGFSLSTTSSIFVKFNPEGEKAEMLRACYYKLLLHTQASGTLQEERHWLHVLTPEFDRKHVRFYLGCSHCGTGSNKDISVVYNCDTCKRHGVTSVPRMNVTFEAVDETGSYTFTTFTVDAEKLLEIKVDALYAKNPKKFTPINTHFTSHN